MPSPLRRTVYTTRFRAHLLGLTLLAIAASPVRAADKEATLDEALLKQAPAIVKYLRDQQKYSNVGVLKFLEKKGEAVGDTAGLLGVNLANRLQVALVLATNDKLTMLQDASAAVVAANNKRANHLTLEGRKAFFDLVYTPAFGQTDPMVKADAFVTGSVEMAPGLEKMTVTVLAFDNKKNTLAEVCKFDVATDGRTLSEAGKSYHSRGPGLDKVGLAERASKSAGDVEKGKASYPLEERSSPIRLSILYGGQSVPFAGGRVAEPGEKDTVAFLLENVSKQTCGVVLKVNGENTLFRQRVAANQCYKWILEPNGKVLVKGFQFDKETTEPFKVKAPQQLDQGEINYSTDLGTYSVDVFLEKSKDNQIPTVKPTEEVSAIARGSLIVSNNPIKAINLSALQSQLRMQGVKSQLDGSRGMVMGSGERIPSKVEKIPIELNPEPLLSQTIRYYHRIK